MGLSTLHKNRIKLWIEVLESGKYKQCRGNLKKINDKNQTSYCCLGVACEIYHQKTHYGKWSFDDRNRQQFTVAKGASVARLPLSVYRWFGLHHDTPILNGVSAISLNDVNRFGFKRIAQEIRKEFNIEKEKK